MRTHYYLRTIGLDIPPFLLFMIIAQKSLETEAYIQVIMATAMVFSHKPEWKLMAQEA